MDEMEEFKKDLLASLEPQFKLVREFCNELNGKVMNYESCRSVEELFKNQSAQWVESFLLVLKQLKEKKKGQNMFGSGGGVF